MGADFSKESSGDSSKSEELHGWLGHKGNQDVLTYSTCLEDLEVSTCSSRACPPPSRLVDDVETQTW